MPTLLIEAAFQRVGTTDGNSLMLLKPSIKAEVLNPISAQRHCLMSSQQVHCPGLANDLKKDDTSRKMIRQVG